MLIIQAGYLIAAWLLLNCIQQSDIYMYNRTPFQIVRSLTQGPRITMIVICTCRQWTVNHVWNIAVCLTNEGGGIVGLYSPCLLARYSRVIFAIFADEEYWSCCDITAELLWYHPSVLHDQDPVSLIVSVALCFVLPHMAWSQVACWPQHWGDIMLI